MATLQQQIADRFLAKLAESKDVDAERIDQLRSLLADSDQTATLDAQTFLTTAQVRLGDYREAMRRNKAAEVASTSAKAAYEIYCSVLEDELNTLYDEVQEDFSTLYRAINEEDEAKFTAKLTPSEGKLEFHVNFLRTRPVSA